MVSAHVDGKEMPSIAMLTTSRKIDDGPIFKATTFETNGPMAQSDLPHRGRGYAPKEVFYCNNARKNTTPIPRGSTRR